VKRGALLVALLALLNAGCAAGPGLGWTYKADSGTGTTDGPLALWGESETMAFQVLRCNARAGTIEFEDIEAEPFPGAWPVRLRAGGEAWAGEERMDPDDGVPVARIRVPLDHSLVTAMGRGAKVTISGVSGSFDLPSGPAVRRVVQECRSGAAVRG
jgi:hypothetical protein